MSIYSVTDVDEAAILHLQGYHLEQVRTGEVGRVYFDFTDSGDAENEVRKHKQTGLQVNSLGLAQSLIWARDQLHTEKRRQSRILTAGPKQGEVSFGRGR